MSLQVCGVRYTVEHVISSRYVVFPALLEGVPVWRDMAVKVCAPLLLVSAELDGLDLHCHCLGLLVQQLEQEVESELTLVSAAVQSTVQTLDVIVGPDRSLEGTAGPRRHSLPLDPGELSATWCCQLEWEALRASKMMAVQATLVDLVTLMPDWTGGCSSAGWQVRQTEE